MAKKKPDWKKIYARRKARGLQRGFSLSQARGHPKLGETLISPKRKKSDDLLEAALKNLGAIGTLGEAAKKAKVSAERFRRFLYDNNLATRNGRKWIITDNRKREWGSYIDGRAVQLTLPNFDEASLNGHYLVAVRRFRDSNQYAYIQPFVGKSVRDAHGKQHFFETDPNELYRLLSGDEPFEQIYRLVN